MQDTGNAKESQHMSKAGEATRHVHSTCLRWQRLFQIALAQPGCDMSCNPNERLLTAYANALWPR
eukprot:1520658-Amphidinium_carterae.1